MVPSSAEAKHLLAFIERIERLEEDKKQVSEDIKEVYAEAKGNGYDVKIMRMVVARRKVDPQEQSEQDELLAMYERAIGAFSTTPLGEYASSATVSINDGEAIPLGRLAEALAPKRGRKQSHAAV